MGVTHRYDLSQDLNSNEKKMILGFPGCKIFFPGDDSGYMHYDAYWKYLKENSALVLGKQITPHAFRYTHH